MPWGCRGAPGCRGVPAAGAPGAAPRTGDLAALPWQRRVKSPVLAARCQLGRPLPQPAATPCVCPSPPQDELRPRQRRRLTPPPCSSRSTASACRSPPRRCGGVPPPGGAGGTGWWSWGIRWAGGHRGPRCCPLRARTVPRLSHFGHGCWVRDALCGVLGCEHGAPRHIPSLCTVPPGQRGGGGQRAAFWVLAEQPKSPPAGGSDGWGCSGEHTCGFVAAPGEGLRLGGAARRPARQPG